MLEKYRRLNLVLFSVLLQNDERFYTAVKIMANSNRSTNLHLHMYKIYGHIGQDS